MVGKSLLFGVLSVLLSFVEPIGRPSYSTSFYSETPCIGQDAELFLDNLPSGNKLFLAEEIVVSPLFEAPCVSFSSDRFSIYPERGDFHLIPKEEKDADSFSTTELVFANGKESFSWRLYTYINRFGQETFSRADKSDAIFENNLYLYRSGKIDEDTYKANVSSISHGDLELVYDFSERKFYVPWNESDSFA
ncbi:MAG: hypothetical protein J5736_00020, partial [Bacilli bacterium]|nr:hypothetical protein [Bacilli bacterium]